MQDAHRTGEKRGPFHALQRAFALFLAGVVRAEARSSYLSLCVGGLGFVLSSTDDTLGLAVDATTRLFCGDAGDDVCTLGVRRGDLASSSDGSVVFECEGSWTLRRTHDSWLYDFKTPLNGDVPYRRAQLDARLERGEVVFDAGFLGSVDTVDPLQFPLAELLVIARLARRDGLELHACGLVDERGRGLLFAGRSGDGKSTTAKLWSEHGGTEVLSDDRIIVRRAPRGFRIFGTPWHGEAGLAANRDVPLHAVFVLEHGPESRAIRLGPAAAVTALLPCCLAPFHDATGTGRALDALAALAETVPCYRLPFAPDGSAVDAARGVAAR